MAATKTINKFGQSFTNAYIAKKVTKEDLPGGDQCTIIELDYYKDKAAFDGKEASIHREVLEIKDEAELSHNATQEEVDGGKAVKIGDKVVDRAAKTDQADYFAPTKYSGSGKTLEGQVDLYLKDKIGATIS